MKRFYMKFRILLLSLALGLASVPFFRMLHEKWTEVRVDVPQIESVAPLIVDINKQLEDNTLFGKRDLPLYEYGGYVVPCDDDKSAGSRECREEQNRIKRFFVKHWKAKKLAYVTVMDNQSMFIEPDENGEWHIVSRTIRFSSEFSNKVWIDESKWEILSVENKRNGKLYLRFWSPDQHASVGF